MQDEAIERLGLIDTGIARLIVKSAWSGPTGDIEAPALATREMQELIASHTPLILVGYCSRFMRSLTDALTLIRTLHAQGTVVYMAFDDLLSTRDYEAITDKIKAAWVNSRDSGNNVRSAYQAKFDQDALPGGNVPMGYTQQWTINEVAAKTIVVVFAEYATGEHSIQELSQKHGIKEEALKHTLRSRTYLGEVHRYGQWKQGKHPAIITPDLFEAVAQQRRNRTRAGGPPTSTPTLIQKRTFCQCGVRLRLDGRNRQNGRRLLHPSPRCAAWGRYARKPLAHFENAIKNGLRGLQVSPEHIANIIAEYQTLTPVSAHATSHARETEQLREALTQDLVARRITGATYDMQMAAIDARPAPAAPGPPATPMLNTETIIAGLSHLSVSLEALDALGDDPEAVATWARMGELFERIEYRSDNELHLQPTPFAQQMFVAESMPANVSCAGKVASAPPEGIEPPTSALGRPRSVR